MVCTFSHTAIENVKNQQIWAYYFRKLQKTDLPLRFDKKNSMILQLIVNAIVSGLLLSIVAIGFHFIFNTNKVFHLAHGAIFAAGGYSFLFFIKLFHQTGTINSIFLFILSIIVTFLFIVIISYLIERWIYQPLRNKDVDQSITLISSMGVYLFIINLIALIFGSDSKILELQLGSGLFIYGASLSSIQIVQAVISLIFIFAIIYFNRTKWYLKIKAVVDRPSVASILGININHIRYLTIAIGGILAAIGGILKIYDTGIYPSVGLAITLSAAVAVILGGNYNLIGTILSSFIIAFLQTLTEWFFSAQWKDTITFVVLILVILWRTEGIVSFKMRIEEK